jgi:hypothetical protein
MQLLRECVKLIIEKIRSKTFDIREFKNLSAHTRGTIELLAYADNTLTVLGDGSSRSVYLLSSSKVLKISQNSTHGISQNKTEVQISKNPNVNDFVAKVFSYDPDYKWIVSELVRELSSEEEFQSITGFPWYFFEECLENGKLPEGWEPDEEQEKFWFGIQRALAADLAYGDIARINHWGKTNDGRLVLLDYGYTNKIAQQRAGKIPYSNMGNK